MNHRRDLGKLHTCAKCGFTAGAPIVADARCANPHACARRRRRANAIAQAERVARVKEKKNAALRPVEAGNAIPEGNEPETGS